MQVHFLINLASASLLMGVAAGVGCLYVIPVWDEVAERRLGQRSERLRQLGFSGASIREALRLWGVAIAVAPFVLWRGLDMPPVALLVAAGLFAAPPLVAAYVIHRRARLLRDQLVGAACALADAVKAGENLRDGLEAAVVATPQPLRTTLRRIVNANKHGQPLPEALEGVEQRMRLESFTLFSVALRVAYERGGRLNEALRRIGASLLENQRVERKMDADTSSGRHAAILMGCFPALFLGLFYLLDPTSTAMVFKTFAGQAALCVATLLTYAGGRWAVKILTIDA